MTETSGTLGIEFLSSLIFAIPLASRACRFLSVDLSKTTESRCSLLSWTFLFQLFFDEVENEVDEFVHAGWEIFFDGSEVV